MEIPVYKQYLDGTNIHDDGASLSEYVGTIPNISLFSLLDTHMLIRHLDKLAATLNDGQPSSSRYAQEWDSMSLYEFGRRNSWTAQAQRLFSTAVRMVLGYETEQVSLLYFLNYVKAAGGTRPLLDSDGGGQDSRIHGGTIHLLSKLQQIFEATHGPIIFESPVVQVDYDNTLVHLHVQHKSSDIHSIYKAKKVIM